MSKIRLGFVGVGGMGQCAHLHNYVSLPDCEVVALSEVKEGLGKQVATRWGIPKVYRNCQDMFAGEKLDGIVCIQQFSDHGTLLPDVVATGLPVIIEKPIAHAIASGEKILAAAKAAKARLYVGYHKRSDPATLAAVDFIAKAKQPDSGFGAMKYIRVAMPPGDWVANGFWHRMDTNEPLPPQPPRGAAEYSDATASKYYSNFVNYFIHQVNLIRLLLGEDYIVRYADPSGLILAGNGVKSGVSVVLEMYTFSTTRDWQEHALVTFDRGWARVDLPAPLTINRAGTLTVFEDLKGSEPKTWSPVLPYVHAMRSQAMQFLKAIKGEKTTLCSPEDALEDLRVARAYIDLWMKNVNPTGTPGGLK